jgi:hypothetical protein
MQKRRSMRLNLPATRVLSIVTLGVLLAAPLAARAADLPVINLSVHQGRFSPETLQVPANTKFKLVVKNEGPGAEEFESSDLNQERVVPAGQAKEFYLGPLQVGQYTFFGDFHRATANGKLIAK